MDLFSYNRFALIIFSVKLFNLNLHSIKILSLLRDPQLQVGENYLNLA